MVQVGTAARLHLRNVHDQPAIPGQPNEIGLVGSDAAADTGAYGLGHLDDFTRHHRLPAVDSG